MSIRLTSLLFPIPLIVLVLPPIFIGTLSFETYFQQHYYSLILLAAWLLIEGITEGILIRWWKKKIVWYLGIMLAVSLALVLTGTSGDLLREHESRWFALSILSLLPLLTVAAADSRYAYRTIISLVSFSLLGLFRFGATLEAFEHPAITLAIVFSIAVAGMVAQKPLLRAAEDQTFVFTDQKAYVRFVCLLWGLLPTTCMIALGNGLLPNIFLSILISLGLMSRMLTALNVIESEKGILPRSYHRLGVATCWFEVILLLTSSLLSSSIAQDILTSGP